MQVKIEFETPHPPPVNAIRITMTPMQFFDLMALIHGDTEHLEAACRSTTAKNPMCGGSTTHDRVDLFRSLRSLREPARKTMFGE